MARKQTIWSRHHQYPFMARPLCLRGNTSSRELHGQAWVLIQWTQRCLHFYRILTNLPLLWKIQQDPHSVDKYQDMYSRRGTNHPYRESRQLYENEEYSRDTSRYVSQYGGTTEIYNPASGGFKEYDHGRVNPETPVYDNSEQLPPLTFETMLILSHWYLLK